MIGPTAHQQVENLRTMVETIDERRTHRLRRPLNAFARHRLARKVSALDNQRCAVPKRARDMANGLA